MNLPTYEAYKSSGVAWLGEIPAHWKMTQGLAAFREKQVKNTGLQEKRVLSLSYGKIIIKPQEKLKGLVPESFETYQIVEPGNTIIRSTDLQNDVTSLRVGLVRDRGIITSAYICLQTTDLFTSEFGNLQLHALDLLKVFYGMGSGLRQNLSFKDFKRMPIWVPPLSEQEAIVRYLDHATHKIDRAVRAKKKLIAAMNEQKQAIIAHVVTRGLDPNIPMKESGVAWLGEIPAHWEMKKLRSLLTPVSLRDRSDLPLLSVVREKGIILRDTENKEENHNFIPEDLSNYKVVKQGQFVMNKMKAWQGSYGVSNFEGIVSPAYYVFDLHAVSPEFFHKALRSKAYIPFFTQASDGVRIGQWDLSQTRMKEIPFWIPPENEQKEISKYIDTQLSSIESAIRLSENEIELLQEYKTRLIADAVTGAVDVRELAKELPEIVEENDDENLLDEADDEAVEEMEE